MATSVAPRRSDLRLALRDYGAFLAAWTLWFEVGLIAWTLRSLDGLSMGVLLVLLLIVSRDLAVIVAASTKPTLDGRVFDFVAITDAVLLVILYILDRSYISDGGVFHHFGYSPWLVLNLTRGGMWRWLGAIFPVATLLLFPIPSGGSAAAGLGLWLQGTIFIVIISQHFESEARLTRDVLERRRTAATQQFIGSMRFVERAVRLLDEHEIGGLTDEDRRRMQSELEQTPYPVASLLALADSLANEGTPVQFVVTSEATSADVAYSVLGRLVYALQHDSPVGGEVRTIGVSTDDECQHIILEIPDARNMAPWRNLAQNDDDIFVAERADNIVEVRVPVVQ